MTISQLPDGDYKLVENAAPTGYVITHSEITFTIIKGKVIGEGSADNQVRFNENNVELTIVNEPGAALPGTGGPGAERFLWLGTILAAGAGVLLWRRWEADHRQLP